MIVAFVVELIFFKDDVKASPKKEAEIADALAADAQANSQEAGSKEETFVSPLAGELIALSDVKDEAFSSGALGNGVAIVPSEGKLYAPCDGEITTFFPTGHAVGITTDKGADILIHVGMDTVKLDGDGFSPKKVQGDKVKQGDLLLEFDIDKIKAAGLEIATPVIVTNSDDYSSVKTVEPKTVAVGDRIIELA